MKPLTSAQRKHTFASTRGLCFYCGIPLMPDGGAMRDAHGRDWLVPVAMPGMSADHRLPTQRGGTDSVENLAPACGRCNSRKGLSTVEEFRFRVALSAGRMPYRFACEPEPIARDFIVVASPDRQRDLIAHNFPDAYGHRPYGGFGR